jgi:hypothetical protein
MAGSGELARSGRVVLSGGSSTSCTISPASLAAPAPPSMTPEESADARFLAEVGRAAGVSRVAAVAAADRTVITTLVDVASATILDRREKVVPLGQTPAGAAREQLAAFDGPPPVSVVHEEAVPTAPVEPPASGSPWYRRWWVWGAVAAVAAGTVTAILISRDGKPAAGTGGRRYDVVF